MTINYIILHDQHLHSLYRGLEEDFFRKAEIVKKTNKCPIQADGILPHRISPPGKEKPLRCLKLECHYIRI